MTMKRFAVGVAAVLLGVLTAWGQTTNRAKSATTSSKIQPTSTPATQTNNGDLAVSYDRFKDITTVTLITYMPTQDKYTNSLKFLVTAEFKGQSPSESPKNLIVGGLVISENISSLTQSRELIFIADEKRMRYPLTLVKQSPSGKYFAKDFGAVISYKDIKTLASCRVIECQLDGIEFKFSQVQIANLVELLLRSSPSTTATKEEQK